MQNARAELGFLGHALQYRPCAAPVNLDTVPMRFGVGPQRIIKKKPAGWRQTSYNISFWRCVFEEEAGSAEGGGVSVNGFVGGTGESDQGLLAKHQTLVVEIDHQQIAYR